MPTQKEPYLLEIFFDDLTKHAQREVLRFLDLSSAKEGNYDVMPLFLLPKPEEN